ncbi:MAG TPA: DUF4252 domain-containing protein [Flavobacterium sp.]
MKTFYIIAVTCSLLIAGCKTEPTLQKYFVEKTESKEFIALDVSPTILNVDKQTLSAEQKDALESFDKMNILAFKLDESNKAQFESEREKVTEILKDEKYQQLMKFGKGKEGGSISFVGDEEHIKEVVVFANKNDAGFAVVRILGKDMNPTDIMNMISVIQQSKINMEQLKPLQDLMTGK